MRITTKAKRGGGSWHEVWADDAYVGVVTRYPDGSWWALRPERYPLGVATKAEAARRLVQDEGLER